MAGGMVAISASLSANSMGTVRVFFERMRQEYTILQAEKDAHKRVTEKPN
ncbi:hypothetical protein [Bartonella henselae]|nr:hypothetical protein [Bartonella henselae]